MALVNSTTHRLTEKTLQPALVAIYSIWLENGGGVLFFEPGAHKAPGCWSPQRDKPMWMQHSSQVSAAGREKQKTRWTELL